MIIFTVIVAIVGWLAPLVSITAQWMFITVPSHAGKVLGIVAGSISSVCYLLFVIFALTGGWTFSCSGLSHVAGIDGMVGGSPSIFMEVRRRPTQTRKVLDRRLFHVLYFRRGGSSLSS